MTYKGAYDDDMVATYTAMVNWIRAHRGVLLGLTLESYRSGPEASEAEHVTVITIPFRRETDRKA